MSMPILNVIDFILWSYDRDNQDEHKQNVYFYSFLIIPEFIWGLQMGKLLIFLRFFHCCLATSELSSVAMQPPLYCFLAGAVALSLVSSTLSFSRGAGYASCRDMIPGHISAHPLDPQHNHIALRTSSSSYLPGQLLIGVEPPGAHLSRIYWAEKLSHQKQTHFNVFLFCIHSYSSKLSGLYGFPAPGS